MDAGSLSAEALVRENLDRIQALDKQGPSLHAIISINPDALDQARALDRELKARGPHGPLHGIPVLIKDNVETADSMPTTAGSLALLKNVTGRDAPLVAKLRAAGAVILGKTNLSEWANFRSTHSVSGWSAVGGLTLNPFVLDRSACGSSAGSAVAVAAGMAVASVGTETDGSITCPAAINGLVGLKPTLGLLPAEYIIPISHSQDTPGPMARTVTDVAILLGAMTGDTTGKYTKGLQPDSLRGKRIGVLRFEAGRRPEVETAYEAALKRLQTAGATLIEVQRPDETQIDATEQTVLLSEFKTDLNAYLASTPASVQTRSLAQLIEFNQNTPQEMPWFQQELFLQAEATLGPDDPAYRAALAESKRLAGDEGLGAMLLHDRVDLLVAPTTGAAWRIDTVAGDHYPGSFSTLPAVSGYPHLTVPMGRFRGLPLGLSLIGPPQSEALLLAAGFAFEAVTPRMPGPTFIPSLEDGGPANR